MCSRPIRAMLPKGATRRWGSAEVSRWEWLKIGLFGLLISLALTSADRRRRLRYLVDHEVMPALVFR